MWHQHDPHDADDICAGSQGRRGGEESRCSPPIWRMYIRYAERHGWAVTVLDETTSDLGGYKDARRWRASKPPAGVVMSSRARCTAAGRCSDGRCAAGGGCAECRSRKIGQVRIDESDLPVDVFRSSEAGRVNTTDRGAYHPSALESSSPVNERSQLRRTRRVRCR